jgi:hypothetical protein
LESLNHLDVRSTGAAPQLDTITPYWDLADDTKWVRVENSKKKWKLADRKSPTQTMQNNGTLLYLSQFWALSVVLPFI